MILPRLFCRCFLYAFLSCLLFNGCKKELIILDSPAISIESIENSSLTTYLIQVKIDPGEGQKIVKVQLVLEDITTISDNIIVDVNIASSKAEYQVSVNTFKPAHDYVVKAVLYTDLYTYSSEEKVLRSVKNTYSLRLSEDELYSNRSDRIALCLNRGQNFSINVDFLNKYVPKSSELWLGTVPLQHNLDFTGNLYENDGIYTVSGTAIIPEDISGGNYNLSICIDGVQYNGEDKIKILDGKWETFADNYEGENRGDYAWFVINDKLYLVGGSYYTTAIYFSPVWCLDLKTRQWTRKSDFPHKWNLNEDVNYARTEIYPFSVQHEGKGYALVRYYQTTTLWKYDEQQDRWTEISQYPGKGDENLTCFMLKDKLYLGGGVDTETFIYGSTPMREFWSYNFGMNTWETKNDLPYDPIRGNAMTCSSGTTGFVLLATKVFWQYDAVQDQWSELKAFPGPWRFTSRFVADEKDLYLIGGEAEATGAAFYYIRAYEDCWKYSLADQNWSLMAFMPRYTSNGISFLYNNKIVAGLGYLVEDSYSGSDHVLYEFTPDN